MKSQPSLVFVMFLIFFPSFCSADAIRTVGDVLQYASPATAFGLTGFKHDKQGAIELIKSYALSVGVTYALKLSIHEQRPDGGDRSFPSAHTNAVFTSAEFLRVRYGLKWGIPFYAAGVFEGYSRVESKEHYVHDVIAGAAIGIVSSHLFTHSYHGWNASINFGHSSVVAFVSRAVY